MNIFLFDTCTWLNLADWRESEVLAGLGELMANKSLKLILPDIVLTEFTRNESDTLSSRERAARAHIKQVRALSGLLEVPAEQLELRKYLDLLEKQAGKRTEIAKQNSKSVRALIDQSTKSITTPEIRNAAFDCCLNKLAPCHRGKNSLADAVILEHFKSIDISTIGTKRFFVTDNSEDFGGTDKRNPHENLKPIFDQKMSFYRTNVAEVMNEVQPGIVSNAGVENVARLQESMRQLRISTCNHDFDENQGSWERSRYGGITWHWRCRNCQMTVDTGEHYD